MKNRIVATLRVNVKSLAAESKFIRQEIKRTKNIQVKDILHSHKVNEVRTESRHTQLALAAVRGVEYSLIERNAKTEPDWDKILKKLTKHYIHGELKISVEEWIRKAREYFKIRSPS